MSRVILLFVFILSFNELFCQVVPRYGADGLIREYVDLDTWELPANLKEWDEQEICDYGGYCWKEKVKYMIVIEGGFPGIYSETYIYDYDSCSNIEREVYLLWNESLDSLFIEKIIEFDIECED